MTSPHPDRTPCACGSYACLVQSPLMCRHTGTPRALNPFETSGPGRVRLRVITPDLADPIAPVGDRGASASEATITEPRRSAPQRARHSNPGRRKK